MTTIKDCIHEFIYVPEVCVRFMNTPEFNRLKEVKQNGNVHYVYPTAEHTRFQHCLGVMHLAGVYVDILRRQRPKISSRTKHLVQLAGLYHDIGHMAYSHLFDYFLEFYAMRHSNTVFNDNIDHEDRSIFLLKQVNRRLQLLSDSEVEFVSNLIVGSYNPDANYPKYLYRIVNNKVCGLDVDKFDYLHRDAYYTKLPAFQSRYIMECAVIVSDDIKFKRKAELSISNLYNTRKNMFGYVYFHHTVQKLNRLTFCMMSRLKLDLFKYGYDCDDINTKMLFRESNDPVIQEILINISNRDFSHSCDVCKDFVHPKYHDSGNIESVPFI